MIIEDPWPVTALSSAISGDFSKSNSPTLLPPLGFRRSSSEHLRRYKQVSNARTVSFLHIHVASSRFIAKIISTHHASPIYRDKGRPRPSAEDRESFSCRRTAELIRRQYSQAVRAGNMLYTSGSVGHTKESKMVEGTVSESRPHCHS